MQESADGRFLGTPHHRGYPATFRHPEKGMDGRISSEHQCAADFSRVHTEQGIIRYYGCKSAMCSKRFKRGGGC